MADECLFKKIIRDLIHEETGLIIEQLKPVIREMITEELEGRSQEIFSSDMTPPPVPPDLCETKEPEEEQLLAGSTSQPQSPSEVPEALYIYGIIGSSDDVSLGEIGIDDARTYTIPYNEISAIVHNCPAEPYQSEDAEIVNKWVTAHQKVLDIAAERFDQVLPFGFDTIISSTATESAREVFEKWIRDEYSDLNNKLGKIRGKKEYGIQVFYSPSAMSERVMADSDVISSLKKEMETKGPGVAYMYRKKIEQAVEQEMLTLVDAVFSDFFGQIESLSHDTRVEKVKRTGDRDKVMMMNISCLVDDEHYPELGDLLETIDNRKEYSVRFTGPWPAYSFV